MKKITYNNVIDVLLEIFPEYRKSEQYYDELNKDLHYIVLGNISLMAFKDIDNKSDHTMAEKLVKLTDDIFNNKNSEDKLVNLFAVEVLESIVGSRAGAIIAKKYLHGKSLELLEQTLKHFSTSQFLEEYRSQ